MRGPGRNECLHGRNCWLNSRRLAPQSCARFRSTVKSVIFSTISTEISVQKYHMRQNRYLYIFPTAGMLSYSGALETHLHVFKNGINKN